MAIDNVKHNRVRYTFYHDSIGNVVIDEPIGFNDDDLEYSRNKDYHGVFTLFSNNLEFYGSSKTIILDIYNTYGINSKLKLTKEVLEEDTTQVNTMLWVKEYEGFLDFTTLSYDDIKATCKFNASSLSSLIKSRESTDIEIERTTTLDGREIPKINTELITLTERDVLVVNQSIIDGTQILMGTAELTPLTKVVSNQDDDFSAQVITSTSGGYTADNFFWTSNSDASTTLNIDVTIDASANILYSGGNSGASYSTFEIHKFGWDGTNYNFIEKYTIGTISYNGVSNTLTFNQDISLSLDDSLALVLNSSYSICTITKLNITASESSSYTTTITNNKFVFIHELLDKLYTIITDKDNIVYSEYFGRTDLGYASLGSGGYTGLISGFWIRNFDENAERYKPPVISPRDLVRSLDAVFNIGMGIEKIGRKERVVIEDKKYFYQNVVGIKLPNQVNNLTRDVYTDLFFNELEVGFSKSGGYDREMGLDEPNAKSTFTTFVTALKNKYSKVSKVRGDSYGKEFARRKPQDKFPTEDTQYDDYNWFLDIKYNGIEYTEKLWSDRFEEKPTGVFSPDTLTNIYFSPFNCLLRHAWWFSSGFEKDLDKYTRFSSSTGNSELVTKLIGGEMYAENGNVLNYELDRPRLLPELIKFEHNVDSDIRNQLKGYTTIDGREVPNFYCLIEFINENGETEQGYLKSLKPNGAGQWEIIKANTNVRRAQQIIDYKDGQAEIFTGSSGSASIIDANVNSAPIIGTLSYVSDTSSSVSLSWDAATDDDGNLDGYYVYYRLSSVTSWTLFSTELSSATSKTVTGLSEITSYDFSIIAFDTAGLQSDRSNIVTQTTADGTAPTIGTLSKGVQTDTTFPLNWTAATDNVAVTGYKVLYKVSTDSTWTTIDTLSTDLTYTVTGLTPSTSYDFKLQAYDAEGNVSSDSNIVTDSTNASSVTWSSYNGTAANVTSLNACSDTQSEVYWATVSTLSIGDTLYTTNSLSSPLVGNKLWYGIGFVSYRVEDTGVISDSSSCI